MTYEVEEPGRITNSETENRGHADANTGKVDAWTDAKLMI